jgi:anaerobic selenocysteine-containing dehydrogenase/Fe-S-cluster-containing dehydrogenase component
MDLKRRDFLKLIGATTVASALPGCTPKSPRSLIPYVIPHEEIIPGRSVWYASVCRECPAGCGVTVRVREGRATKAEGNPRHPVNKGALCARGQASLQGLYHPDRIQAPLLKNAAGAWEQITWEKAEEIVLAKMRALVAEGRGKDAAWVTPYVTGSLDALVDDWLSALGSRERYRYEPVAYEALRHAGGKLFGVPEVPEYDFAAADVIYSFGADFLETWLSPVRFAGEFSGGRGFEGTRERKALTCFGPRLSMTAANADSWIDVHPDMLGNLALALVHVIVQDGKAKLSKGEAARVASLVDGFAPDQMSWPTGLTVERIEGLARTFAGARASLAIGGGPGVEGEFAAQAEAAVGLLNYVCGNVGTTVRYRQTKAPAALSTYADMERLVRKMDRDEVPALFLSEVNPVYAMPPGSGIAAGIGKVPFVVACATMLDETAALAHLVLPLHTPLESWGDFEPCEGVHGLMQPVMVPVFPTRMLGDILLATGKELGGGSRFAPPTFHEYVRERWRTVHARLGRKMSFEAFWVESLARGGAWESVPARRVSLKTTLARADLAGPKETPVRDGPALTLLAYPSISFYDGRGADKPWLQELPDPMSRTLWGSWLEIGSDDATRLGLREGDRVQITSAYGRLELPAHIFRGMRPGFVAIPMGQGHTHFGRYGTGVGVNVMTLLDPKPSPGLSGGIVWSGSAVELLKLPGTIPLASVQEADSQHDRGIIETVPLAVLRTTEGGEHEQEPSLYAPQEYPKHQWGMVIDADKCTGCAACVTACYAENNVPVVGRDEVMRGREMAWIRIDRYYEDRTREIEQAGFLPMLCQQCGSAPCETVCPVYAAYHTDEGLNGQVYNRCIGTRYCANNCPYKVRRFNWFDHEIPEPLNWQLNPDVTVRSKGVMEKCTFCVQRIVEAKNNARIDKRNVRDGEITTACQQSCPAQAITFGDLKDPESAVSLRASRDLPRPYAVLGELNTRPAVTYLKKIKA